VLASDSSPPPTQLKLCQYIKERTTQLFAPKKALGLWAMKEKEKEKQTKKKATEMRQEGDLQLGNTQRPPVQAESPKGLGGGGQRPVEQRHAGEVPQPQPQAPAGPLVGMNTKPAKPATSMFSGLKMGGGKPGKG
jgi:hypothetical protein